MAEFDPSGFAKGPEEILTYKVELDTSVISEQLAQLRQNIDDTLSNMPMGGTVAPVSAAEMMRTPYGMADTQMAFQQASDGIMREQGFIQNMADRSQQQGLSFLDEIKRDTFMLRPGAMPEAFGSRSTLENMLGGFGFGYDQQTSPYSAREYIERSRRNTILSIPLLGTEEAGNRHMANFFRDVSFGSAGGSPLSDTAAMDVASQVRNLDLDPTLHAQGFDRGEIARGVQHLAVQGEFVGDSTSDEYVATITKALGGARSVMQAMRQTYEAALETQTMLGDLGFGDPAGTAVRMASQGATAGLSGRDMLAAAQLGGALSGRQGVDSVYGAAGMMDLLQDIRVGRKIGDIDSWRVNAMGGELGAAQGIAESSSRFWNSGQGIMAALDGNVNSPYDILDAQSIGDTAGALNPKAGTQLAVLKAAEVLQQMTGTAPDATRAVRMAQRMFGIDFNAGMIVYNDATGFDLERGLAGAGAATVGTAEKFLGSAPNAGGVTGEFENAMRYGKGVVRDIGSTFKGSALNEFVFGSRSSAVVERDVSIAEWDSIMASGDLEKANILAGDKLESESIFDFGTSAKLGMAAVAGGSAGVGGKATALWNVVKGAVEDFRVERINEADIAAEEATLDPTAAAMPGLISMLSDVGSPAELQAKLSKLSPKMRQIVINNLVATGQRIAANTSGGSINTLDPSLEDTMGLDADFLEPLSVQFRTEEVKKAFDSRIAAMSPAQRARFEATFDEKSMAALMMVNRIPISVHVENAAEVRGNQKD